MSLADKALRTAQMLEKLTSGPAAPAPPGTAEDPGAPYRAKAFYESLTEWIKDFENGLDADHEVGARFGNETDILLTDLSYWNPQLIRFDGIAADGNKVQLIQHVSQISVLLIALPKRGATAQRLGFRAP